MADSLLPYFIPFGVALAAAGVLRLAAGAERGAKVAGISFLIGYAAAWEWLLAASWMPYDDLTRVIHVAIGGALLGLIVDFTGIRRSWTVAATAVFVLGCVWATISGALLGAPPEDAFGWVRFFLYLVIWLVVIARLDHLKNEGPTSLVICLMAALGLGLVAQMSGEGLIGAAAYALAAAFMGFLVLSWVLALAVGSVIVLGGGGSILAMAMALAQPGSEASLIALMFLFLVLYADGTAKRLPLGPSATRPALYPLALIMVTALPVILAGVIAFLLAGT